MRLVLGSDHAGYELKQELVEYLRGFGPRGFGRGNLQHGGGGLPGLCRGGCRRRCWTAGPNAAC